MKRILTFLFLSLPLAGALNAQGIGDLSDSDRQALRDEIRAYLLENPEVLYEAIDAYEAKQRNQQAISDAAVIIESYRDIFNDGASMILGNENADVFIAEFFDYKCGYCKAAYKEMRKIAEEDDSVAFVLKEFPILGEESLRAARYAVAVRAIAPDQYLAYHDKLVMETAPLTDIVLRLHASSLGVDVAALEQALDDNVGVDNLRATQALAQKLNITGTPGFVLGESILRGYLPKEQMQKQIETARNGG